MQGAQNSANRGRWAAGTCHPGPALPRTVQKLGARPRDSAARLQQAGLPWRCLHSSSTRQDTRTDTQPGSGRGTVPAQPVPEKQAQHRGAAPRPRQAGSAQQSGLHSLTNRQNLVLCPQHRSVAQQLPKTLRSPRGPSGPAARRQRPAESRGGALGNSGACHGTVLMKNKLSGSSRHTDVNFPLEARTNSQLSEWRGHTLVLPLCHPGLLGQPSGQTPAPGAPPRAGSLQRHPRALRACTLLGLSPCVLPFRTASYRLLNRQTGHRQLPRGGADCPHRGLAPAHPLQGPGPSVIRCTDRYRPAALASSSPPMQARPAHTGHAASPAGLAPRFLHCCRLRRPQRPPCLSSPADSRVPEPSAPGPASRPRRRSVISVLGRRPSESLPRSLIVSGLHSAAGAAWDRTQAVSQGIWVSAPSAL